MPNDAWPRLLPGSLRFAPSPKLWPLLFRNPKPRPLCTAAGYIRGPSSAVNVCSWCRVLAPSLPLPEPDWGTHVAPDRAARRVSKRGADVRGGEAWPDPGGLRAGTARPLPARQEAWSRAQVGLDGSSQRRGGVSAHPLPDGVRGRRWSAAELQLE